MPAEALENLILDAIDSELAKIGTPPTSSWLTTTPPARTVGIPGANVPSPNLMSLYLQHVRTEVTTDAVGVATHILKCTFAVWACSSHTADGHRRMLNLLEDVRQALTAAEGTFHATFGYGIDLGASEFSGNEAWLRQGIAGCALEVIVHAQFPHPVVAAVSGLNHPFEFPLPIQSGKMLAGTPISPLFGPLANGARLVIFSSPVGTRGIVRNISFITNATLVDGSTPTIPDLLFEVKYDGSPTASISIPLLTLVGMEYPEVSLADLFVSTPIFEITAALFKSSAPTTPQALAGNWRLPIPYTNGIEISVVAPANTNKHTMFANVLYQDVLPAAWNDNLRLFADRSNASVAAAVTSTTTLRLTDATHALATVGTFPSNIAGRVILLATIANSDVLVLERTDATHLVVSGRDTVGAALNTDEPDINHATLHQFLSRPAGEKGWIAGIVGAHDGNNFIFEGNPRFFLDQAAEADLTWTSIEDMANGAFYFDQKRQSEEGGIISHNALKASVYKSFYKHPIRYSNGVSGKVPNFFFSAGPATLRWTTFYYREI